MVTARVLEIVARMAGRSDPVRDDLLVAATDLARYFERRAADPAAQQAPVDAGPDPSITCIAVAAALGEMLRPHRHDGEGRAVDGT